MKEPQRYYQKKESGDSGVQPRAVGYLRVSTAMQATEGLSLEAQQSAIEGYCAIHGIKLVRICKDVILGGKDQRLGLQDALSILQSSAGILIVLKFDRLSRSIKYFCELYERYFKAGTIWSSSSNACSAGTTRNATVRRVYRGWWRYSLRRATPRERANWWPAQVQQLLDGRFDAYYHERRV